MFYVYLIYSESADRYYIGHTSDPERRLNEHNTSEGHKYTSMYRPWVMHLIIPVSEKRGEAIKVERFIKKQKNRQFIKKLVQAGKESSSFDDLIRRFSG